MPDLETEIVWTGDFTFAAQIADRYREGRVFLVGDAAHRMTPRGAAGMNTAIHDGYDLGWKLGWVLRGWAGESLLDSFEAERRPVGLRNMQRSAIASEQRDVSEDYLDDIADRIPHVWLPDGRTSTLDLLGDGLTVLAGPRARVPLGQLHGIPVAVHRVDPATADVLGTRCRRHRAGPARRSAGRTVGGVGGRRVHLGGRVRRRAGSDPRRPASGRVRNPAGCPPPRRTRRRRRP